MLNEIDKTNVLLAVFVFSTIVLLIFGVNRISESFFTSCLKDLLVQELTHPPCWMMKSASSSSSQRSPSGSRPVKGFPFCSSAWSSSSGTRTCRRRHNSNNNRILLQQFWHEHGGESHSSPYSSLRVCAPTDPAPYFWTRRSPEVWNTNRWELTWNDDAAQHHNSYRQTEKHFRENST